MIKHPRLERRSFLLGVLLLIAVFVFVAEVVSVLPRVLEVWHPYDYWQYTQMGNAVRQGQDPLGPGRYYPLPTILWVFVPLSLLPDWFRLIWILVPLVSILVLFRKQGMLLFIFTPLWLVVSDAMLDGWLLLPMAWLLANRPGLAGIGAVALLIKPQLAILTVGYMLLKWLVEKDRKNLTAFGISLAVFVLPSFVLNPAWPLRLLQVLPMRASETLSILPQMTSSVWSWWWLGGIAQGICLAILIATGILAWTALRRTENRAAIFQSLNLLFVPVLFGSNVITLVPALQNRQQIIIVVLLSLGAFGLDKMVGNFGGGYVLIPLVVLYFQMTGNRQ